MFAVDGKQYTLSIDFDAGSYHVVGNGIDETGSFAASGAAFAFTPAAPAPTVNNATFTQFGDTVTGGFRFGANVTPFMASRSFVNTVVDAAGQYKFLTTTADPSVPANVDTTIFTGEIVAPNTIRFCQDNTIFTIETCPAASIMNGTVTNTGADFRADFGSNGAFPFRVANVGADKVFLRASASLGTQRRFYIGFDQNGGYADTTFRGVNNAGQSAITTAGATRGLSTVLKTEANAQATRSGTTSLAGPPGLLVVTTAADGTFFTMQTTNLGVVFAARGNTVHPGYAEIGKR